MNIRGMAAVVHRFLTMAMLCYRLLRFTSEVVISILILAEGLQSMMAFSRSTAICPMTCLGTWTVVSGGSRISHMEVLSKPMMPISSGMRYPASLNARMAPAAIRSLSAK